MTRSCRLDFVIKHIHGKEDRVKKVRFLNKQGESVQLSRHSGVSVQIFLYFSADTLKSIELSGGRRKGWSGWWSGSRRTSVGVLAGVLACRSNSLGMVRCGKFSTFARHLGGSEGRDRNSNDDDARKGHGRPYRRPDRRGKDDQSGQVHCACPTLCTGRARQAWNIVPTT